jgi:hypothetical protein
MNKKAIAAFAAFLAALTLCASCGRQATSPYGKVIVDERGMEHVILTDAAGNEKIDSNGNLIEVVTDSDSKKPITLPAQSGTADATQEEAVYETAPVTATGVRQERRMLEDQYMTIEIPKGWESLQGVNMMLRQKSTGAQITIYPNIDGYVDSILERHSEERDVPSEVNFDADTGEREVAGYTATYERMVVGDQVICNYYIWTERAMTHEISCMVAADLEDSVDFDTVLNTIQFK